MVKQSKSAKRKAAQVQDKGVLVELPNPKLHNAFGDPFMLRNLRFDETLLAALRNGDDEDIDEDDPRLQPLMHADLSLAIESFLRSRDPKNQQHLVVASQADSDHVWDIGECLQKAREEEGSAIVISKSDHRWLLQKAKELAHKAFPMDARMFLDHLDIGSDRKEEEELKEKE